MSKPTAGVTYQVGEWVLTRSGWGFVEEITEERFPEEITDEVTYECKVKLQEPDRLGNTTIRERNPMKVHRYVVITRFWNIGDPSTEAAPQIEEFDSEEEARNAFERADASSGQVVTIIYVDHFAQTTLLRRLTIDGEVLPMPPQPEESYR
jgi:hypothetical protein